MTNKLVTFDEVFLSWIHADIMQIEGRDILPVAKQKGFNSISEWRLATALRLGLDTKEWHEEQIDDPENALPKVIVGPYQGWSVFFDNKLTTSFEDALKIPEFLDWCKSHDRIIPITQNFPPQTKLILLRKENGDLVHIEGGHRICAIAYTKAIGQPINLSEKLPISAYVANLSDDELANYISFLTLGTDKQ